MALTQTQRRTFIFVSGVLFLGSMAASTVNLVVTGLLPTESAPVVSEESSIEAQVRGYELVLQREPNNITALEGLANTRLEMNDPKGAIAPLEKLVKLNPDNADYAAQLAEARQQAGNP
ncbi:tetratricopeptide repeat protein [Oscillatoria sp. FACHB-1407]|uniref:tetratricopeptide repeat protein n=1 Tax=Oscillatoria sp. FACHB-1407 TaxID=2692847 RepID=UPI001685C58A|nr:tetratricopeptide repeat protein [Oscillatoria sp. FACHB-1407]MBD2462312.1 tetratricopeptide repeat protein [Oscillatoria sp. FACHB-1407]